MQTGSNMMSIRAWLCATLLVSASCGKTDAPDDVESDADVSAAPSSYAPSSASDADAVEIEDYELTMDDLHMWSEANLNLQRAIAADPQVEAALEEGEDDTEITDVNVSLDAREAALERVPAARDAVEDAGLSAREYVVIGWALIQTGMARYELSENSDTAAVVREMRIHPENLRFVQEHQAEITELRRQLRGGG